MRNPRFQNLVATGRLTLPVAILISVSCWMLSSILLPNLKALPSNYPLWDKFSNCCTLPWANNIISFILYSVIGYFLIEMNNKFAIIRMRASVQTAIYFVLISICPYIHILYAGDLAATAFLIGLYFLFKSYQQERSAADLFHSFIFLGIGSVFFPQLIFFIPAFWIGAYNFQSLQPRSFFASLIGWTFPYWLLLGYAYFYEQMDLFYAPFRQLVTFAPINFHFDAWQIATFGYLFILFIVGAGHCLIASYEDKIRTRSYLNFLIFINLLFFIYAVLQPALSVHLMPILLIGISILTGHLFILTSSPTSNRFFILTIISLFILFAFNLWTLL